MPLESTKEALSPKQYNKDVFIIPHQNQATHVEVMEGDILERLFQLDGCFFWYTYQGDFGRAVCVGNHIRLYLHVSVILTASAIHP